MIGTIELFEALKTRFGEEEAKVIVKEIEKIETGVEAKVDKAVELKTEVLKNDIKSLKEHIDLTFATKEDIANSKADMIKWMFIFWIGQVAVIAGLLAYFFHLNK
jgi:hypothetical protein